MFFFIRHCAEVRPRGDAKEIGASVFYQDISHNIKNPSENRGFTDCHYSAIVIIIFYKTVFQGEKKKIKIAVK